MTLNFDKLKYELECNGFTVIKPCTKTVEIASILQQKFDHKFIQSQNHEYNVNIFREADLESNANSGILKYNYFCKDIITQITQDCYHLHAIFQTYDTSSSAHIAQDPHFDRIPTLKFMLYVNELAYNNGAFCLSPGSHHWVRQCLGTKRQSHGSNGFLELSREIPTYIKDKIIPVEGGMGTVIIFNTDCIHHQGLVEIGSACIVRSHYRRKMTHKSLPSKLKGFYDPFKALFNRIKP